MYVILFKENLLLMGSFSFSKIWPHYSESKNSGKFIQQNLI